MPLLCNRQYMGRKHKAPFTDRVILFQSWNKAKAHYAANLDPECECHRIAVSDAFKGMTPLTAWGKYFQSNVQLMLNKVRNELPDCDLAPYSFEVTEVEGPEEEPVPIEGPDPMEERLLRAVDDAARVLRGVQSDYQRHVDTYLTYVHRKGMRVKV